MASRAAAVADQPKVVGGGKAKNVQAEGRNRRVLKDIGNLVTVPVLEGKPHNRPITRNFGAQMLAKAQAAEAEKNNCKKALADYDGLGRKEVAAETKGEAATSPDGKASYSIGKNVRAASSKKKKKPKKTLTSTMTARSKAVCGLGKKPKETAVLNIDANDAGDELAVVEYVEDIYRFYEATEEDGKINDYMRTQPEINSKMRAILVDWLIEVHKKFELMPESLYLAINVVDRFLSVKTVPRNELQLVGISSMLIACKYEEIWPPAVRDFIAISDNAYIGEQVLLMEKAILEKLEWCLTVPTPYVFLARFVKASVPADKEMENMAYFFAELGLLSYSTVLKYNPSKLSASAVYAARCTLEKSPLWTDTLKHYTGYGEDELKECSRELVSYHRSHIGSENKLKAVFRKYSNPERASVSLFPPAKHLLSSS